jgi:hypothetical protein
LRPDRSIEALRGLPQIGLGDDVVAVADERVSCPAICIATCSGMPALTMLHTAVRRRSCISLSGIPAAFRAFRYDLSTRVTGRPCR